VVFTEDLVAADAYAPCLQTFKKPRRPFEKERLDAEMKLLGEFGLRGKREIWRVQMALSKIRTAARTLLTMDEKDPKRIFEGEALLRRMYRYGLLVRLQAARRDAARRSNPRVWRTAPPACRLAGCRLAAAAARWRRETSREAAAGCVGISWGGQSLQSSHNSCVRRRRPRTSWITC
jgi:hypothetical protein